MAERTLVENVAQVKADFKAVKDAVPYVFNDNPPTSEYGERIFTEISSLQYQADSAWDQGFNNGIEQGRTEGIEQGIEQGKQEVISNSKYIEKQASGKLIALNDVSEVAHKVVVKADTPTEVKVCGKNLFNNDVSLLKEITYTSLSGTLSTKIGYERNMLPAGTYTFSAIALSQTFDAFIYGFVEDRSGNIVNSFRLTEGTVIRTPLTITIGEGDSIVVYDGVGNNLTFSTQRFKDLQIQLEVGSSATEYEPYIGETITATPSGTEIPSMCPIMTFLADSDVTVDYFGSYGMQTEYDRFWDAFQYSKGLKMSYSMAFSNPRWSDDNFKPKYDIVASDMNQAFYSSIVTDLVRILTEQGVTLDTSQAGSMSYAFGYSTISRIPTLNLSKATNTTYMCSNYGPTSASYARNQLRSIEKIISSETTVFANNAFSYCDKLEHCIFEGTIASNINLQWSKRLNRESILSLLSCLNATVTGKVATLPSKCIDTVTDTLTLIQGDTELNTAYTQALANGYTITFA